MEKELAARKQGKKKSSSKAASRAGKNARSAGKTAGRAAERNESGRTLRNEIAGILIIFVGVFLLYAQFARESGVFGEYLHTASTFLLGSAGTVIMGLALILFGIYTVTRFRPFSNYLTMGAVIFAILNVMAMMSLEDNLLRYGAFSKQLMISLRDVPTKGGLLGAWLGGFYRMFLSEAGGYIFASVMILICLVVIFRESLYDYRQKRRIIRKQDREVREKIKQEKFDTKLRAREEAMRNGEDRSLIGGIKERLISNPYDDEPEQKTEEETESIRERLKREYEEHLKKQEEENIEPVINTYSEETEEVREEKPKRKRRKKPEAEDMSLEEMQAENDKQKKQIEDIKKALKDQEEKPKENVPYVFPKTSLLMKTRRGDSASEKSLVRENITKLEETLATFRIGARVTEVSIGPAVTRYEVELEPGIKVSKVVGLQDNIAMALAANGDIRMEAPIPGKSAIGIEVPNRNRAMVRFRELVESEEFRNSKSKLSVALAKNITGKPVIMDIAKLPHLLIAGATGSGKSVCINTIINSILFNATPEEVRLILIDPKMVELSVYEGIPHLLVPVETNPVHAASALKWAEKKMEERYSTFARNRVKNIESYNEKMQALGGEKMPHWLIIVDELADLMMTSKNMVEPSVNRLAQLARAAGIHLVIATQRPSVDVITGLIKANIPSRISFSVSSQIDSRTILDGSGAESLLGNGDMLYAPIGANSPIRAQGAYIDEKEVEKVVEFIKSTQHANYDEDAMNGIDTVAAEENLPSSPKNNVLDDDFDDDKFAEALNLAFELGEISTSMLQRRLRIGYARAGRIVDEMEQRGIVSEPDGSKPRKVLKKREDFFSNSVVESDEVYPEGALDIEDEIY